MRLLATLRLMFACSTAPAAELFMSFPTPPSPSPSAKPATEPSPDPATEPATAPSAKPTLGPLSAALVAPNFLGRRSPGSPRPAPPQSRLTVLGMIYHQPGYNEPGAPSATNVDIRYGQWLESEEQPYTRLTRVGEEWTPLDVGWIPPTQCSLLILLNEGPHVGTLQTSRGSPAREVEEAKFPLLVGMATPSVAPAGMALENPKQLPYPFARVAIGKTLQLTPTDASQLLLRCPGGVTRYRVYLFPA